MMEIILPIICIIAAAILYANAIINAHDEDPDYKGDDFLN
jgi:hypothetical protein